MTAKTLRDIDAYAVEAINALAALSAPDAGLVSERDEARARAERAEGRLREISDLLEDAGVPGGTTLYGGVMMLRERAERAEAAVAAAGRKTWQAEVDPALPPLEQAAEALRQKAEQERMAREMPRWLKDGESPLERIEREHRDNQMILGELARAKQRAESYAGLVEAVREWQAARKPMPLPAPGEKLAETYQAAVRRMAAADEALAGYDLNGPAGGALVGQTAPTESTGVSLRDELAEIIRWRFKSADGKPLDGAGTLKHAQEIADAIVPVIEEAVGER